MLGGEADISQRTPSLISVALNASGSENAIRLRSSEIREGITNNEASQLSETLCNMSIRSINGLIAKLAAPKN
jgi:hypothetical protein